VAVVAQRNGVRLIAFQKCGHTSLINMFLTPADMPLVRGDAPAIRNSGDEAAAINAYRGDIVAAQNWPKPDLTIAFFRNPLLRALSAYEHFIVRTLKVIDGVSTLGRQSFTDLGFTADMDFAAFVLHLRNINLKADNHLKPQSTSFIEAYNDEEVYAGQLEQLDTIWPLIVAQYGLDCTLEIPRYNEAEYITHKRLSGVRLSMFKELYARDYAFWKASYFEAGTQISSVSH